MTKQPTESIRTSACSLVCPQVRPSVYTHSIGSSIMSFIKPRKIAHANSVIIIPILMKAAEYGRIMSISHFYFPCMFFFGSFGFSLIPWSVCPFARPFIFMVQSLRLMLSYSFQQVKELRKG